MFQNLKHSLKSTYFIHVTRFIESNFLACHSRPPNLLKIGTFSHSIKRSYMDETAKSSNEIKRPSDSWVSVLFPFKADPDLRSHYTDMFGNVLIGKLYENFDALAASIAYKHVEA
jgi:hypothetical protein